MGLLDGRTAIITGSARGIGRATAELFAAEGAQVTINDIDGDIAEQAAGEIKGETIAVSGDLTKEGACDDVVKKTLDAFGKVDIVVNNAGYTWDGVAHKMTDEQFQAMLDIHMVAPFRVLRAASTWIRETAKKEIAEGRQVMRKVVNITSISGMDGIAGQAGYGSGKAGIIGLTKVMAKEWGRYNVNVNAVGFGFIETRLTQPLGGEIEVQGRQIKVGVQEAAREALRAQNPLGRFGTPEEAAGPVVFFCSPMSDYVTGEVLLCSGGSRV